MRPNSGKIDAGGQVEVQVLLQAMKEDPPLDARCRDKFLVKSVPVPAGADTNNVTQIWQQVEATAKGSVQERKIRVSFLPADGSSGQANGVGPHQGDDESTAPPAYSSPSPAAVTPQRPTSGSAAATTTTPSEGQPRTSSASAAQDPSENQSMLSSVSAAIPTSREELQRQLDAANAKVKQLQEQASEGLRQRRAPGTTGADAGAPGSTAGLQTAPAPGGVPVPYVAALCALCFMIAWLFF